MDIILDAPIVGVTVYPERALVVRRGTATIEAPGEHILRVVELPQSTVQRNSFRATGSGPAGTRILGIEQASEFHGAPPEATLSRLRDEIARLRGEIALVDDRAQILEEQRGWLRNLGEHAARTIAYGISRGTAKAEEAGNVFAYSSQEAERLAAARIELDRRREELQRELEARERELRELGGTKPPDRLAAMVRISITTPGTVEIQLSYLVSGAMWRPRYDARVDIATQRVRLTQQAIINQRTDEDWSHVALAVSTAQPSAAAALPDEPDPWYLDILKPPPPPAPMVAAAAGPMRMARMSGAGEERERGVADTALYSSGTQLMQQVEAEIAGATAERSGAAQIFHLPGRNDIPSDGAPHTVGIGDYELPCRLDYVAVPVLTSGAHLRATAANTTGQVLLPGELHIFHAGPAGDEYVGATKLDLAAENADLKLYLGVDDNITVKRELIERDTDKGSLLQGGVRRITCGYRVTLSNRTGSPQRIVLKDRLPVPRHERIKLRVLDMRPQPSAHTKLEQLTWELQLAPDDERRIEWRFVVESPADIEMIGLPA
jgi:uncharacterized protein (TIGR02231 family)